MPAHLLQNIYDLLRGKKKIILARKNKLKYEIKKSQKKVQKHIKELQKRILLNVESKYKIGFLIQYPTAISQYRSVFEQVKNFDLFNPFFIINIDINRDLNFTKNAYIKCKNELVSNFGETYILDGYDLTENKPIDVVKNFDFLFTTNPYDDMAGEYFKISYNAKRGIPCFFCNYGFSGFLKYSDKCLLTLDSLKFLYKFYCSNENEKKCLNNNGVDINVTSVTGYAKMDNLYYLQKSKNNKYYKTILICSHHTLDPSYILSISSFLKYCDFLLTLPLIYTQIKFIFRPHPFLMHRLKEYWGENKVNNYIKKIKSYDNAEFQTTGEYFQTFIDSDALINDCGSFLCEYLYTDKPQCYMFKDELSIDKNFNSFGKEILDNVYKAFNEQDITDFIEKIVIKGDDYKKENRIQFAKSKIRINYPYATNSIVKDLMSIINPI